MNSKIWQLQRNPNRLWPGSCYVCLISDALTHAHNQVEFSTDMLQTEPPTGTHIISRSQRHKPVEGHCLWKLWFSLALGLSAMKEKTEKIVLRSLMSRACDSWSSQNGFQCSLSRKCVNAHFPSPKGSLHACKIFFSNLTGFYELNKIDLPMTLKTIISLRIQRQ